MTFRELILSRQSVRGYSSKKVDRQAVDLCIEAARLAPSACNSQPWSFIVVDEPALKERVAKATTDVIMTGNKFALSAPVLIVVVAEKPTITSNLGGVLKNKEFWLMDIGMAAEHICLQAAEEGLGTCMLGWFNERAVQKMLGVPKSKRLPLIITLGYPVSGQIRTKVRKEMDEVRRYNAYK